MILTEEEGIQLASERERLQIALAVAEGTLQQFRQDSAEQAFGWVKKETEYLQRIQAAEETREAMRARMEMEIAQYKTALDLVDEAAAARIVAETALADLRSALAMHWSDASTPEDGEIRAAHPTVTGRHDLYTTAMRLVGARRSKGSLILLVNWLLFRAAEKK